ncbi:MAG: TIGR02266 family protein [bacterium]
MTTDRKNTSGPGRRQHPRIPVRVEVFYGHGADFASDYMLNVSRGGLFIETFSPLDIGTRIDLRFSLPAFTNIFNVKGEVVWKRPAGQGTSPPGMGVQFVEVDKKDAELIDSFVRSQVDAAR